jgi:hypothetical protein
MEHVYFFSGYLFKFLNIAKQFYNLIRLSWKLMTEFISRYIVLSNLKMQLSFWKFQTYSNIFINFK